MKEHFTTEQLIKYARIAWISVFIITLGFMVLTPLIGSVHYFLDLFSHYQFQFFVLMFLLIPIGYLLKFDKRFLLTIIFILIGHFFILLYPINLISAQTYPEDPELFFMNGNFHNDQNQDIINEIKVIDSDTVVIVEANSNMINGLTPTYGAPIVVNGEGALKCAIFTKKEYEVLSISGNNTTYPICGAKIDNINMIVIHPTPPLSLEYFNLQQELFREVEQYIGTLQSERYILMGDFNSTSYNSIFRKYFGDIHRVNNYSWEVRKPYMLPIDHVMGNFEIELQKTKKLSSDHVGIIADF